MHKSQSLFYLITTLHISIELIAFSADCTLLDNCNFNLVYRYSLSVNLNLTLSITA